MGPSQVITLFESVFFSVFHKHMFKTIIIYAYELIRLAYTINLALFETTQMILVATPYATRQTSRSHTQTLQNLHCLHTQ